MTLVHVDWLFIQEISCAVLDLLHPFRKESKSDQKFCFTYCGESVPSLH